MFFQNRLKTAHSSWWSMVFHKNIDELWKRSRGVCHLRCIVHIRIRDPPRLAVFQRRSFFSSFRIPSKIPFLAFLPDSSSSSRRFYFLLRAALENSRGTVRLICYPRCSRTFPNVLLRCVFFFFANAAPNVFRSSGAV